MKNIELKSKCIKMADFKTIDISQFVKPIDIPEKIVNDQLVKFMTRYATTEEVNIVENRDVITLTCKSDMSRYNKQHMQMRVGLGLLGKEFESQLMGLNLNEKTSITVDGNPVAVVIEKIKRDVLPKPTDEFAKSCKIPTVTTMKDLENYVLLTLVDDDLEEDADNATAYMGSKFFGDSEFELDEEELNMVKVEMKKAFGDEEESEEIIGLIESIAKNSLEAALAGQIIMAQYNEGCTEKDYEEYVKNQSIANKCSEDEIKKKHPIKLYAIDEYGDYVLTLIENYATQKLIELGRKGK